MENKHHQVRILLAVWGEKYIKDFLQLSLPSLLAPGNIPAMAKVYPLRLVFLTQDTDIDVFENNQVFKKLKEVCAVEFISIKDLIVFSHYSTTLTLAYDRAVRLTGEQMLNTYFVFLTADYVMANGSLEGLMRYIKKGYSGICAGNFQVIEEEFTPYLLSQFDAENQAISIQPQELLNESFKHLHPIVFASMYSLNISHNYHVNRFYLRQDSKVLAGRFYLLHMLCIKPETTEYRVGSSCDYSFIPEMCPSGNVGIITDSDDYLVVEIQPKIHELEYINPGRYDCKKLTQALSEWTTERHRENAKHTIYFHSRKLFENDISYIEAKLDDFIDNDLASLKFYEVQPYYNHPYWLGALAAFNKQKNILRDHKDCDYFNTLLNDNTWIKKIYYRCFGTPPVVFPWHHRWYEYCSVINVIKRYINSNNYDDCIILYEDHSSEFMWYYTWLKNALHVKHQYHSKSILRSKEKLKELENNSFSVCVLMLRAELLHSVQDTLTLIKSFLKKEGKLLILIPNTKNHYSQVIYDFRSEFAYRINYINSIGFHIADIKTINNNVTFLGEMAIYRIKKYFSYSKKTKFAIYALLVAPAVLFNLMKNTFTKLFNQQGNHCTNILVTLIPDDEPNT